MFKNFIVAILIATLLVYCLGMVADSWGHVHLYLDDDLMSPAVTLVGGVLLAITFIVLGLMLAVSLIGALAFVFICVLGALLIAGIGALWPALLGVLIIVWLVRDAKTTDQV
ncbi:hypothetical protein KJY73_21375 [Bowmanella sp. Y26]|uniref:Phage holin family protein n=1 Tax=Bowmanella yangjiangensis TaxID=2811230 RepID=A0ABS3CXV2_9ALTE|nr:hypothetical protein [Bowmanella yangjiangensis]MBN7821946.1 hypothetical protein [Bowmanella yangjiangensis]MBT1066141.1 hypothetical protein [Bowmanella yangjiangensis]